MIFFFQAKIYAVDFHLLIDRSPDKLTIDSYISPVEWILHSNLTETLVRLDERNQLTSNLAKKWKISKDGRTYSFDIRDDRKWSDGQRITAQEVATSIFLAPGHRSAQFLQRIIAKGPSGSPRVTVDGQTVSVTLKEAFPALLSYLVRPEFGVVDWTQFSKNLSLNAARRTSGPYMIGAITKESVILSANPFRPKAHPGQPDRAVFQFSNSRESSLELLKEGYPDFYESRDDAVTDLLRAHYQVIVGGYDSVVSIQARQLDKTQMQALAYLSQKIDRKRFIRPPRLPAENLVAHSVVTRKALMANRHQIELPPIDKIAPIRIFLSPQASESHSADLLELQKQAEQLKIPLKVEGLQRLSQQDWEDERYPASLTSMGVYTRDEVELLYGYFCAGFSPYRSLKAVACQDIERAGDPLIPLAERRDALKMAYQKILTSGMIVPLYFLPRHFLIGKKWKLVRYNKLSPYPYLDRFSLDQHP